MTTFRQSRNSHFFRGQSTYQCGTCKRMTRNAGDNGQAELCPQCWDLAGMDNECNDNGRKPTEREAAERDSMLAHIASKGGDVERVIKCNEYLFPAGYKLAPVAPTQSNPKGKQTMNTELNSKSKTIATFEKAFGKVARKSVQKPSKVVVTKPAAKPAKAKVQRAAKPSTFDNAAFDNALALAEAAVRKGAGACEIVRTVAAVKALERKDVMAIAEMVGVNKYTASRQFFLARHGE